MTHRRTSAPVPMVPTTARASEETVKRFNKGRFARVVGAMGAAMLMALSPAPAPAPADEPVPVPSEDAVEVPTEESETATTDDGNSAESREVRIGSAGFRAAANPGQAVTDPG